MAMQDNGICRHMGSAQRCSLYCLKLHIGSVSDQVLLYCTRLAALWVAWLPLEQEGAHILRCAVLAASCRQTHHGIETTVSHGVMHMSLAHIVASVHDVNTPQHAELAAISSATALKAVLNTLF